LINLPNLCVYYIVIQRIKSFESMEEIKSASPISSTGTLN